MKLKEINESILCCLKEKSEADVVETLFEKKGIKFKKNSNGSYDIDGDIDLKDFQDFIEDGKLIVKFGKVSGNFYCRSIHLARRQLKDLTSLEGCPVEVGGDFKCSYCDGLTSLAGAPKKVGKDFECESCKNLKSLVGGPSKVGGSYKCSFCESLKNLEGAPVEVPGNFGCHACYNLTSLKGAPKKVGKTFFCQGCESLMSLDGAPAVVGEDFSCDDCGREFSEEEIREHTKLGGKKYSLKSFIAIGGRR